MQAGSTFQRNLTVSNKHVPTCRIEHLCGITLPRQTCITQSFAKRHIVHVYNVDTIYTNIIAAFSDLLMVRLKCNNPFFQHILTD